MGDRPQEAYTRAVRMLVEFCGKPPDLITETALQDYCLHRKNADPWSANTMRICDCAIRFFFVHVLRRDWPILDLLRAQSAHRLPVVRSREVVRRLRGGIRTPPNPAFLSTVSAGGLRLQEAQYLEVADIASARLMLHVHRGKGAKDRYVPLPQATLQRRPEHGKTHRHPRLSFPALRRRGQGARPASTPLTKASIQGALRQARHATGIHKRNVCVPTRRHRDATPLLEAGVNRRAIPTYLGQPSWRPPWSLCMGPKRARRTPSSSSPDSGRASERGMINDIFRTSGPA